ncbi:DUF421 domain-containing protein [Heliophilum fasciatum]|uniref:Uncharacterized membrane protein YcaP (DUF421 family) n=1 Tax=Heliophilum fasciatum TaxID=35700 RepID=A0A4V2SVW7_9FIRM|nr:DUF421 domain-containing protein [Heliophilum fasciatum]MCW2279391.1 uncharacterized membrane protein YcaP (DUF421 family) [Heliophilum fasciatum]TCP60096.1 uncharacterized membrane protein YcaP (DUF421 family) [Heliophilum fasciatum]
MILTIIRTIILFSVVVIGLRLLGKRQIGQLQPYELVVIILISELAAIPMENIDIPIYGGIIPILTLLLMQVSLSYISMKSESARGIICGTPSILVENGKIVEQELARLRYNVNDLLEQIRSKDVANLADVEFAILETGGQLNVIPKSQKRPVTPSDLGLSTPYEGVPVSLIIDGQVLQKNLDKVNLTEQWLKTELSKFNVAHFEDVFFASIDTEGKLYYQLKSKSLKQ